MPHSLNCLPRKNANQGYILLLVMILMLTLLLAAANFFNRSIDSARLSGYLRDTGEAQQLAEAAINRVTGRFISGIPDNTLVTAINDLNADGRIDRQQIRDVIPSLTAGPSGALPNYVFYVSANMPLAASAPVASGTTSSLLQAVADGEARAQNNLAMLGNSVANAAAPRYLRINTLFASATERPLLFVFPAGQTGFQLSAAPDWNSEPATRKVAVWLELVANPTTQELDMYAQAAALSGGSRAYLQRRIGSHSYNQTLGGLVAPLSESGNRF